MRPLNLHHRRAFTLIEVIVVIAIIGIMTSLVITTYRNVAQDSRDVVARQQQAALQGAINNWITTESTTKSMAMVRSDYAAILSGSGSPGVLLELQDYLDERTFGHLQGNSPAGDDKILSDALIKIQKHLQLSTWSADSYPQVRLKSNS